MYSRNDQREAAPPDPSLPQPKPSSSFFRPPSFPVPSLPSDLSLAGSSLGNDERWDRGGMLHHSIVPMGEKQNGEGERGREGERNGILFAVQ